MHSNLKYPFIYIIVSITFIALLITLAHYDIFKFSSTIPDPLKAIVLLPILISLISTNLPDFMSKKIKTRLKWIHTRPGINQLYYFIFFQALTLVTVIILKLIMTQIPYWLVATDIITNLLALITIAIYITLMLRVLKNN
jgi:hypothetical protein